MLQCLDAALSEFLDLGVAQAPSLPERAPPAIVAQTNMRFLRDVRGLLAERGGGVGLARAAAAAQARGVVEQCVVAVVRLRSDVVQRHVRGLGKAAMRNLSKTWMLVRTAVPYCGTYGTVQYKAMGAAGDTAGRASGGSGSDARTHQRDRISKNAAKEWSSPV